MGRTRSSERGTVMIAVLVLALVLGMTCGALVIVSAANATAGQNNLLRTRALNVAEIGIERAKADIVGGTLDQQFYNQAHQATESSAVQSPAGEDYGSYDVRVVENYGSVEGQYLVVSRGTIGRTKRQLEVVIRRGPNQVPDFLAAINLYNPNGLANFSGSPPRVCGLDTNIPTSVAWSSAKDSDCVAGSGDGPDVVGVGVHDDASVAYIIGELGSRPERISGADGSGGEEPASVYNVSNPNPSGHVDTLQAQDIVDFADQCIASADFYFNGSMWTKPDGTTASNPSFGSLASPKVVVLHGASGTIHLNGTIAGAGLMIIDCDVQFGGTFNYAGLILITNRGSATVSVDMRGTPLVLGSIVAANPGDAATSVLDLRGTADVFYSRQGLEMATQALVNNAKFSTRYYAEKAPDDSALQLQLQ